MEKKYSRVEPPLNALYGKVREFYGKEEYFTRFFKRLNTLLVHNYGHEKTVEIMKVFSDPRVSVRGLESFFGSEGGRYTSDIGDRASKRSSSVKSYILECKKCVEEVFVYGYKNVDITRVFIAMAEKCKGMEETRRVEAVRALTEHFLTYTSNPFELSIVSPFLVPQFTEIDAKSYKKVMDIVAEELLKAKNRGLRIPSIYRLQGVRDDRVKRASQLVISAFGKGKLKGIRIEDELKKVNPGSGSDEELELYFRLAEHTGRSESFAIDFAAWAKKILSNSTLLSYYLAQHRLDPFCVKNKNLNVKFFEEVKAEDIYMYQDKEYTSLPAFIDIKFNCKGVSLERIEIMADLLVSLSIAKERHFGTRITSYSVVHKVVLTGCTDYSTEFANTVKQIARRLASKYNKSVAIEITYDETTATSKTGLPAPEYLRVVSDLHVDVNADRGYCFDFANDFIVSCGDIAGDCTTVEDFVRIHYPEGVMVVGNHLGYSDPTKRYENPAYIPEDNFSARIACSKAGQIEYLEKHYSKERPITLLENNYVIKRGIAFVGTCLYTDFRYFGDENQAACMMEAARGINDFRRVLKLERDSSKDKGQKGSMRLFNPEDYAVKHTLAKKTLVAILEQLNREHPDTPVVIVTHFVPNPHGVAEEYKNDPLTAAFATDCRFLLERNPNIRLICFGHTHKPFDFIEGGCRWICNPFGYFNENGVDTEEYGTRVKLSDVRSSKPWKELLTKEIEEGEVKVYDVDNNK